MSYKIYVHHKYSHERFWYFFHGVDVDINDVVIHTSRENAFNKFKKIEDEINIKCKYNNNELDIYFVGDKKYAEDGHHILDYSIDLYDRNLVSDRGFNSNIRKLVDNEYIPLLNKVSKYRNTKYHFMYIDWEGHNPYYEHKMGTSLSRSVNLYVDEINDNIDNKHFVFTNTFMSFIYPNTLGLREYIFFADILKYKDDYNHKINFPIRRFYRNKLLLFNSIMKLDNRKINVTHSSFHDTHHYAGFGDETYRAEFIKKIGTENFIEKRGYGIDDWGGEWNSNNLDEFMWKMFGISEVNIIPEYDPTESIQYGHFHDKPHLIGKSYISEKSVSHILANKPFIPLSYSTIEFYETYLKKEGYDIPEFPIKYNILSEVVEELNDICNDEIKWKEFKNKLENWLNSVRKSIFNLVDRKNSLLEVIITTTIDSKSQII